MVRPRESNPRPPALQSSALPSALILQETFHARSLSLPRVRVTGNDGVRSRVRFTRFEIDNQRFLRNREEGIVFRYSKTNTLTGRGKIKYLEWE